MTWNRSLRSKSQPQFTRGCSLADYLNFDDGVVVEVKFPFDDCTVASNGKVMFSVSTPANPKMKLGVTPRAFEHVFGPALGCGGWFKKEAFGTQVDACSYAKGQTLWVVKTGNNPNMDKREAFKDPELSVKTVTGQVYSTGTPYNFAAAPQGQPQQAPSYAPPGAQAPPSDASRRLPQSGGAPPQQAPVTPLGADVSRPCFNERLSTLAEGYGRCFDAAHAFAVDTELTIAEVKDIATHFSMTLLNEGYYQDLAAEVESKRQDLPPSSQNQPMPAPSGPPDDDLPF